MGKCNSKNNQITANKKEVVQNDEDKQKVLTKTNVVKSGHEEKPPAVEKEIEFNIQFKFEGKQLGGKPKLYKESLTLGQVVLEIAKELQGNSDYSYTYNSEKLISSTQNLKSIFEKVTTSDIINIEVIYEGLDIPNSKEEIIQYYSKSILLGIPVPESDPFELRVYHSKNNSISTFTYSIEEYPDLKYFSHISAYCNAENKLYISGGEIKNDNNQDPLSSALSSIFEFDLSNGAIKLVGKLSNPRYWHTMIYVPKSYIFFVGGTISKVVEMLDLTTNKVTQDSDLNDLRCESSLCLVNSTYLYAFCGLRYLQDVAFIDSIERCNLRKQKRKWEIVKYTLGAESKTNVSLDRRFFSICYFSDSKILFVGGDDIVINVKIVPNEENNAYNYLYDFTQDNIELAKVTTLNGVFLEKFAIPTDDNCSVFFPLESSDKVKVAKLNVETLKLETNEFIIESTNNYESTFDDFNRNNKNTSPKVKNGNISLNTDSNIIK